ncbi:unnamed protein product, partial [Ascophyllum nodosum]
KAYQLRKLSKEGLTTQLSDLRTELQTLRVAQVTGGAASKLAKISVVRKKIARVLTVYHQAQKQRFREHFEGKKYIPLDLRPKKTRAIRRRLTMKQLKMKTVRQSKKDSNLRPRCYALKA